MKTIAKIGLCWLAVACIGCSTATTGTDVPAEIGSDVAAVPPLEGDAGSDSEGGQRVGPNPIALFERYDENADGKLDEDELPSWIGDNLDSFDADKDRVVTLAELQERMSQFVSLPTSAADQGADGSPPSLTAGPGGVFDFATFFNHMDEDSDGKLVGEEIAPWMRRDLEAIDSNGDKAVTLDELRERGRQRRAERRRAARESES